MYIDLFIFRKLKVNIRVEKDKLINVIWCKFVKLRVWVMCFDIINLINIYF